MFGYEDDGNEDSAASIVEERRFEDGQPSKIRLRFVQFKVMVMFAVMEIREGTSADVPGRRQKLRKN